MNTQEPDRPPARAPWPPMLIVATLAAGATLDAMSGGALKSYVSFSAARILGGGVVTLAIANDIWCAATLARHRTTIMPHRAASHLATDGPFQWSRNPIYISHVAATFGLGLLLNSPFTILLTPLLALALARLSIEPEERHLLSKFGEDYRAYMARTRRWL